MLIITGELNDDLYSRIYSSLKLLRIGEEEPEIRVRFDITLCIDETGIEMTVGLDKIEFID